MATVADVGVGAATGIGIGHGEQRNTLGQRDIASLRVDIEIVWVFAAYFLVFFILLSIFTQR